MQKIVPFIWCNRDAEDAAGFYADAFPGATTRVTGRYPSQGLPDFQAGLEGLALTVDVVIDDLVITLMNAGPGHRPTHAISFMVNVDPLQFDRDAAKARAHLDALWERLADGGTVMMPLGEYPFSPRYGWVEDRYGVSWQLILTNPDGDPRPVIIPNLLFGAAAQNRAGEAIEYYTDVFQGASIAARVPYAEQTGPAAAGAVMFSDFTLEGQWFAAMDAATEQSDTFGDGISLQVLCDDQQEIDHYWAALSAVPEAEQCGWCVDRFGVSWQVIPRGFGELLKKPGAFERMSQMKKIVIAEY